MRHALLWQGSDLIHNSTNINILLIISMTINKCECYLFLIKYYYIRICHQQSINIPKQLCHTGDFPIPTLQDKGNEDSS